MLLQEQPHGGRGCEGRAGQDLEERLPRRRGRAQEGGEEPGKVKVELAVDSGGRRKGK